MMRPARELTQPVHQARLYPIRNTEFLLSSGPAETIFRKPAMKPSPAGNLAIFGAVPPSQLIRCFCCLRLPRYRFTTRCELPA